MISIEPVAKRYVWGSYTRLNRLFGLDAGALDGPSADPTPLAEMWFSGHHGSPSPLHMPDGAVMPLDEAIRADPDFMVGPTASRCFGPVLPYLFKVISARIPLSLQVHPVGFEARAGYHREQAAGVPLDAPERSFRDAVAKHEMVVALEPFEAAVGFMLPELADRALAAMGAHPLAARMRRALAGEAVPALDAMMPDAAAAWPESRRRLFRAFAAAVTASAHEGLGLAGVLSAARDRLRAGGGADRGDDAAAYRIVMALGNARRAAEAFPGDPSALALLMMNPLRLEAGQAAFIPAGTPHEYIHGTAAEIMTNSDNVLRAGMTVKRRDIPNLLRNVDCRPIVPSDPRGRRTGDGGGSTTTYRPPVDEFMLSCGRVGPSQRLSGPVRPPQCGPRVLLCVDGRIRCADGMGGAHAGAGRGGVRPGGRRPAAGRRYEKRGGGSLSARLHPVLSKERYMKEPRHRCSTT